MLKAQSEIYLAQSNFPQLIDALRSIDTRVHLTDAGTIYSAHHTTDEFKKPIVQIAETSMGIYVQTQWFQNPNYSSLYRANYFVIEAQGYGTIVVHGGRPFGTTTLSLQAWQDNVQVQEEALGKAYRHPLSYLGHHASANNDY